MIAASTAAAALCTPFWVKRYLRARQVVDIPNDRSSHETIALRGGGLSTLAAVLIGLATSAFALRDESPGLLLLVTVLLGACSLSLIGWVDDRRGLSIIFRFSAQLLISATAVAFAVHALDVSIWWAAGGAAATCATVNAANFMDGLNGMSALHGLVIGATFLVTGLATDAPWLAAIGAITAVAFVCFLPWNLGGKLFLGDVGSYLLGGLAGLGLTVGAMSGVPLLALLGPLTIYAADTSTTLAHRVLSGQRWRAAHRDHLYQRLQQGGRSHWNVSARFAVASAVAAVVGLTTLTDAKGSLITMTAAIVLTFVIFVAARFATRRTFNTRKAESA